MPANYAAIARIVRSPVTGVLVCMLLFGVRPVIFGQEVVPTAPRGEALKFDEFEDLKTDDVQAHLDLFARELEKKKNFRGFIAGYRRNDFLVGSFLREIYGYQDYMVNKLGIEPERIGVVDGGVRDKPTTYLTTQLWLVSTAAELPVPPAALIKVTTPRLFDSLSFGSGCEGEYTLVLANPDDALKFFAPALKETPGTKGFIFVHPDRRESLNKANKLARSSQDALAKKYRIPAEQIVARVEGPRPCAEIDLWLVPPDLRVPENSSPELFLHSQLMAEAERKQYSIRRVEFLGNAHLRDNLLRRRIPGLQEGEIFTTVVLGQNLAMLSRLKAIRPVGLKDVAAQLDREDKSIDLVIVVSERRRHGNH